MSTESDKYQVLEKIGHGSFGIIRKVRRRPDGMILCRKEISYLKMSQKEREQLHAEFQILSTLRHPNIVGYYHREHLKATQDLHLYMEYCGNGDLGRVIRDLAQKNQYAEESFVWSIFSQLVTALFRCHYGVDPPEVGKTVLGLGATAKPSTPKGGMVILHRDLKPENVFLGEDNSVKLGDFGLAKIIQSHDFASTYVGTPFYMSPEICAAEKYTLKSDIWSLGCIIFELCSREPPFNAKTHFQLVQKIKEGKFAALPPVYSTELSAVIKDCLRVNPDRRPDTAMLLNLPVVRLMRKEKEVAEFSKTLKGKEDALDKRMREFDQKMASVESIRLEIDASLRREWEVKARLEIDRHVTMEIESLQRKFEHEVRARVEAELLQNQQRQQQQQHQEQILQQQQQQQQQQQRKMVTFGSETSSGRDFSSSSTKSDFPLSSSAMDGDLASATDLTDLSSLDTPESSKKSSNSSSSNSNNKSSTSTTTSHGSNQPQPAGGPPKRSARTPFARAQTFAGAQAAAGHGTPMDIEMASPSPITIASLSLSPRRNAGAKVPPPNPTNIFAGAAQHQLRQQIEVIPGRTMAAGRRDSLEDDDQMDSGSDSEIAMPSPTRNIRSNKNPFGKQQRPGLPHAQKSAPGLGGLRSKQQQQQQTATLLAAQAKTTGALPTSGNNGTVMNAPDLVGGLRTVNSNGALRGEAGATTALSKHPRRLSKIPSAANLAGLGSLAPAVGGGGTDALGQQQQQQQHQPSSSSGSNGSGSGSGGESGPGPLGLARKPSVSNGSRKEGYENNSAQQQQQQTSQAQGAGPVLGFISKKTNSLVKGRTLVELQQARAAGRPMTGVSADAAASGISGSNSNNSNNNNAGGAGNLLFGNLPTSPSKRAFREHATAGNRGGAAAAAAAGGILAPPFSVLEPAAIWDSERDEMPSPFLVRRKPMLRF